MLSKLRIKDVFLCVPDASGVILREVMICHGMSEKKLMYWAAGVRSSWHFGFELLLWGIL